MKKFFALLIIGIFLIITLLPLLDNDDEDEKEKTVGVSIMAEPKVTSIDFTTETIEIDETELAIQNMQQEMDAIETLENQKDWFVKYKEICDKYSYILDQPTVYDYYTEEEIILMCRVVETECFDQDFISKVNVASVIFNRELNEEFGKSIEEIITKKNQFAYGRKNITEETILAVEYAFAICDTTGGCIAFRSDKKVQKWCGWEYVFTDEIGHHFYKEMEEEK